MAEEIIDQYQAPNHKRPALLSVMCVLTWIVSAYILLTVPFNYFFSTEVNSTAIQSIMNEAMASMAEEDPEIAKMMEGFMLAASNVISNALDNAGWIATTDVLVALLSAFGAYLMFSMKKMGFWLYLGAKVASLISVLAFLGINVLTIGIVSIAAFIGAIVVVLYAVNLKRME